MSKSFIQNKLKTLLEQYIVDNQLDANKLIDESQDIPTDVVDSFKLQKSLNKDIWDDKDTLSPKVKFKLLEIAKDFFKELELPSNVKLKDIIFTGSLANFNWSKFSDIDLHLVIDYSDFKEDKDFITKHFKVEKTLWNDIHDIKIYSYPVEIYVQNIDDKLEATAIYSVLHNKWILKPSKQEFSIDKGLLKKKADKFFKQGEDIKKDYANKDYKQVVSKIDKLWDRIKTMRKAGLEEGGEFSLENILFKVLRRTPFMDGLDGMRKEAYDKSMTLNEAHVDANGELIDFSTKLDYPYEEILDLVKSYVYKNREHWFKLGWAIFNTINSGTNTKYNSKTKYVFKVERITELMNHDFPVLDMLDSDEEAYKRAKEAGFILDEDGIVLGLNGVNLLNKTNSLNENIILNESNVWTDGGILLIKGAKLPDGNQRLYATHIKKIIELPRNRKDDTKGVAARMAILSDVFYVLKEIPDPNIEGNTIIKGFKMDYRNDVYLSKVLKMKNQSASIVLNNNKTPIHWESLRYNSMGAMLNRLSNDIKQIPNITLK